MQTSAVVKLSQCNTVRLMWLYAVYISWSIGSGHILALFGSFHSEPERTCDSWKLLVCRNKKTKKKQKTALLLFDLHLSESCVLCLSSEKRSTERSGQEAVRNTKSFNWRSSETCCERCFYAAQFHRDSVAHQTHKNCQRGEEGALLLSSRTKIVNGFVPEQKAV